MSNKYHEQESMSKGRNQIPQQVSEDEFSDNEIIYPKVSRYKYQMITVDQLVMIAKEI
jgi:hypothetical protein